ncbi:hypothetical protein CJF30_00005301 [Rutstroemia sp. NJR-2017a BBW]|nr:hypothetical protein CJF30_00005301 [Rutstroemia sp. NJR-2017a BBW]
MSATPFIQFIAPTTLDGYDRTRPSTEQPDHIPKTFLDAISVREAVFVKEQSVPIEHEFDSDDPRACHWVIYASVNPIGTIRLVPFPHPPHPQPGGRYAAVDRATTYHDGVEPYIKLGRLAVLKEFRGAGISKLLANAAISWAVAELGMEKLGASGPDEIPLWNGLTCVHAQEQVASVWAKWGFKVDEGMGMWWEEGIKHVGMFLRVNIEPAPIPGSI